MSEQGLASVLIRYWLAIVVEIRRNVSLYVLQLSFAAMQYFEYQFIQ